MTNRRRNRQRPLGVDRAGSLARGLLIELTPHAGDTDAVNAVLLQWFDDLDASHLAQVCMKAVQLTFAECLTPPPPEINAPPGALALIPPANDHHQDKESA